MTTDVGYELGAALRSAVDGIEPPLIDLPAIKRAGRRRRYRARAVASSGVVFAAGLAAGLFISVPGGYGHNAPSRVAADVRTKAIAHVRAFYRDYALAQVEGPRSVRMLVGTYTAVWYTPILRIAASSSANPVGCAEHDLSVRTMEYQWVGVLGGQAVVLTRWRTGGRQMRYNVVSTVPRTAEITGITCVSGEYGRVTSAARVAVTSLYSGYLAALRAGITAGAELMGVRTGASVTYFRQLATASLHLSYDPVLCQGGQRSGQDWPYSVGHRTKIVAGGTAALIVVQPQAKAPILTVVQRATRGFAVTNIACSA